MIKKANVTNYDKKANFINYDKKANTSKMIKIMKYRKKNNILI